MNKKFILKLFFLLTVFVLLFSSTLSTSYIQNLNRSSFCDLKFRARVLKTMLIEQTPSLALCILKNDEIIWHDAYGFKRMYPPKKADIGSIYVLGSISKTFIGTAIMQLYEKGLLDLDCDISCYLPFMLRNPNHPDDIITIRMILAHQSGLGDKLTDLIPAYLHKEDMLTFFSNVLLVNGSRYNPKFWCDFKPGEESWYSNFGFILCSIIIERLTGKTFEEYCQENIFQPLHMYNTSFCLESYDKKELAYPTFKRLFMPRVQLFNYDLGYIAACGGLRTNIIDLSHYLIAHMNNGTWKDNRILNDTTVKEMHRPQFPDTKVYFYGYRINFSLGWMKLDKDNEIYQGYNGGALGYSCTMIYRESDKAGFIYLSNGHANRIPSFLCQKRVMEEFDFANYVLDKKTNMNFF